MGILELIVIWGAIFMSLGGIGMAFYYGRKLWLWFKKNLDIYRGI